MPGFFELAAKYPYLALAVFALAVGFMWLFLFMSWFFLSGLWVTTWEYRWRYYLRPRVARWWSETSELWNPSRNGRSAVQTMATPHPRASRANTTRPRSTLHITDHRAPQMKRSGMVSPSTTLRINEVEP